MSEDFAAFFNANEHGTEAIYNSSTITGIFENNFVAVNGVETSNPTFLCPESDVAGIAHGDVLTIGSVPYTVVGTQSDGTGLIFLILQEP